MAHEQFNIANGHRIREKKNNKNKDLTYSGERETYVSQRTLLYYYYVPITVVGFRRVREEKTNILLLFPRT